MTDLLHFLASLRQVKIYFRLEQVRDDAIMVQVAVPGERWEVEFFDNGEVEVEVFQSNGKIEDATAIDRLFARFADKDAPPSQEQNSGVRP